MDPVPGRKRESAILWALRWFGLARPQQPPPPLAVGKHLGGDPKLLFRSSE
jgi:hypothetical protein